MPIFCRIYPSTLPRHRSCSQSKGNAVGLRTALYKWHLTSTSENKSFLRLLAILTVQGFPCFFIRNPAQLKFDSHNSLFIQFLSAPAVFAKSSGWWQRSGSSVRQNNKVSQFPPPLDTDWVWDSSLRFAN